MTLDECTAILGPFALALRAPVDAPTFRAYAMVLEAVPVTLFAEVCDAWLREPDLKFLPSAPEFLGRCEARRRAIVAAASYDGCAECEGQIGWRNVLVDGVSRMERCPCKARHLERLASRGLPSQPLAQLPAAVAVDDGDTRPRADGSMLPSDIRERLAVLARKSAW
jgi:hypothetical protein